MLQFDRIALPQETDGLRAEVREFLAGAGEHLARPNSDFTTGHDPAFSRKLGARAGLVPAILAGLGVASILSGQIEYLLNGGS